MNNNCSAGNSISSGIIPHRKNSFFTFLFSFVPGAGEMYMGFMKQGLSLMTLFFGILALCVLFNMDAFLFILPIVWCYGFFHVHNINSLTDEEFASVKDEYLFHLDSLEQLNLTQKYPSFLAFLFIFIGADMILNILADTILYQLPNPWGDFFYILIYRMPQLVLSFVLIYAGVRMIRNRRKYIRNAQSDDERFFSEIFKDSDEDYFAEKIEDSEDTDNFEKKDCTDDMDSEEETGVDENLKSDVIFLSDGNNGTEEETL
ncbi:MAG: hypothetical protein MR487_01235 [Lachnospiraceae bacterium]|nr:hypothetical protein [Lachnospiraceae bacterium]